MSTYSTIGPECPYCGDIVTTDDPAYFSTEYVTDTCVSCGKTFNVEVNHTTSWSCEEIEEDDAGDGDDATAADG